MENYEAELRRILEMVIGLRDDQYGYPNSELDDAEERLGVTLPHSLRYMYRYCGRHVLWRDSHHQLVAPVKLTIDQGRLVFLNEVQNVVQILLLTDDLRLEDPPAYQLQPAFPNELYREADSLALYLLQSLCWQLVCIGEDLEVNYDGLEMSHGRSMSHEQAQSEVAGMTRVSLGNQNEDWTNGAYYAERAVAFVFVEDDTTSLWSWNAVFNEDD